jgi:secondary thiamine-phosphate synthase enzyme
MRTHRSNCTARTQDALDFVDITDEVQAELDACGIGNGQVTVFTESPSCVLIVNERESGLLDDIRSTMERLENTGMLDQKSLLGSSSVVIPAVEGRLRLGIWQRLLLVELERPDTRKIVIQIVGE